MTLRFNVLRAFALPSVVIAISLAALAAERPVIEMNADVHFCPVYRLRVFESGRVEFQGEADSPAGVRTADIGSSAVRQLMTEFEKAGFLDLDDRRDPGRHKTKTVIDCVKQRDFIASNKAYVDACKGRKTIEIAGHLRIEAGDDWLMYRSGERSKTIHPYEVDPRALRVATQLQERVKQAVDVKRWTGPGPCSP